MTAAVPFAENRQSKAVRRRVDGLEGDGVSTCRVTFDEHRSIIREPRTEPPRTGIEDPTNCGRSQLHSFRRNAWPCRKQWPAELDLVCRWYQPHLERIHGNVAAREADLVQLAQIASTYPSRERFLTEITLDPPNATSDEAGVPVEDYLILSTIHSAKGQEWKSVFLLNTIDGCIPSDLATGTTARSRKNAVCCMSP